MPRVERVRPWLGTLVSIAADGADPGAVCVAVDGAFAAIEHVHARMSFQSPDSDLAAIGRLRAGEACALDPATARCLAAALALADESAGVFDPVLPGDGAHAGACWRDLRLEGETARVARPLRVDLSGIAKGFAVDRACAVLRGAGIVAALVNAGGDLAAFGRAETIALHPRHATPAAAVTIADCALASSDVAGSRAEYGLAQHRDGRTGAAVRDRFASVVAPCCTAADALTKVVLALGADAAEALARRRAVAYLHDAAEGWRTIGDED